MLRKDKAQMTVITEILMIFLFIAFHLFTCSNSNYAYAYRQAHEALECKLSPKHMRMTTGGQMRLALVMVSKVATYSAR